MSTRLVLAVIAVLGIGACTLEGTQPVDSGMERLRAENPADPRFFEQQIGGEVHFATGSHAIGRSDHARLARQARWLLANPQYNAVVEGYADERGAMGYNQALAARRARAVIDVLVANGVSQKRLHGATFGENLPKADCISTTCLKANRRAVTTLVDADTL